MTCPLFRCGLSQKNKLSYERFLSAFQDNRHAGYGRVTLDTPGKVVTPVVFERQESLSPDAAINRLRNKIGENPETIQRVSKRLFLYLCFKTSPRVKPFTCENDFDLHESELL